MATKHPRVNVTLDKETLGLVNLLAKKQKKSRSAVAGALIAEALELQEDLYFSKLADERERTTKRWISHEDAWK